MRVAVFVVALCAGGCDSTCRTVTCSPSAATYQICPTTQISTYKFGGQSCTCDGTGHRTGCSSCLSTVASFCGGSPPPCTITLSGALTGVFACESFISYESKSDVGAVGLAVNDPSPLAQVGVSIERFGTLSSGVWTESDSGGAANIGAETFDPSPLGGMVSWDVFRGFGAADQGQYTVDLTVFSSVITGDNTHAYYPGSGTVNATLPAFSGGSGIVTLSAAF